MALAFSASIHAVRGHQQQAQTDHQASTHYMIANTGPADQWQRNQHY
jgi:hypothetical protein